MNANERAMLLSRSDAADRLPVRVRGGLGWAHSAGYPPSIPPHTGGSRLPPRVRGGLGWGSGSRAGSLLLEMTTAAGVLLVVVGLAVHLLLGLYRHNEVEARRLALLSQARAVRHALLADVRRSSGVLSAQGAYRAGPSTLILRLPASAEARSVVYHGGSRGIERILVGRRHAGHLPDRDCLAPDLRQLSFRAESVGTRRLIEATVGGKAVVRRRRVGVTLSFGAATRGGAS